MKPFKTLVLESIESVPEPFASKGFILPGQKAKFKMNEEVYVSSNSTDRFLVYHSKKTLPALNSFGFIRGYKYQPGAYSKYLVELPNKELYAIHSHFISKISDSPQARMAKAVNDMSTRIPELQGMF